ncbi:MAG TPA: bifunctional acetate--CoA ligase family protein/GNAT family N-acetyltransferase [Stellaceae bacterium]|nr:bifunctional acetate--CoA ligase family protein/GNAT family N-acetyltransferase [Stellaceae bacterium]
MSIRNLDKIFAARSVAMIGATPRAGSVGALAVRNLRRCGFHGELMLVNPHHSEIDGLPVYPSVAALPQAPDLAVIATPPETIPRLIAELGVRGTSGAVVITGGFGELGGHGRELQQQILDAARPHLLRVVGPNCVGIMVPRLGLDASFSHLAPPPGGIAFVSQSGAMITAMLDWAAPRQIGFSYVVSLGDMADVDFGDMLDYLATDPDTSAVLLYVEAVTHGRKFMSAARAAARTKPVLVLKAGRSSAGAKAASSHTGALAGADAVYEAAFRRAGMLRVGTMAELFDAAETLALTRDQRGDRLAIMTNGGGAGVLAADALVLAGGTLSPLSPATVERLNAVLPPTWSRGNPVDLIGDASGARYVAALAALFDDDGVDAVLAMNCPTALAEPAEAAEATIDALAAVPAERLHGRNVFAAWLGEQSAQQARRLFAGARIASYATPDAAVTGFMHRVRYRRNQDLLMETPPTQPAGARLDAASVRRTIAQTLADGSSWLAPEAASAALAAYGIPVAATLVASDAEAAAMAAEKSGFPVVLKIRSPDITHKSDFGGVALGLADTAAVRREAAAMLDRVRLARPEARIHGFLVQAMVSRPGATELLVGIADDPVFGPVVAFGQGGTAVEIVNDTSLEFPPLNAVLVRAQMMRTRVWLLLQGYRGTLPAKLDAVVDALIRVARLAADHPEIRELDINPLLADDRGVIALDARVRVTPAADATRLAIAPYPQHLETVGHTREGVAVRLRPLRPEDEPLLHDLVANMTAEDRRMRFFATLRGLSHAIAARLSQLDYDREMAILAECEGVPLGVARYAADPDNRRAEFAVAVRSDWKGRGLGYLLMTRLIEIATERGVGELVGAVLRENKPMLDMCRVLGFIPDGADDMLALRVTKVLKPDARRT